VDFGHACRDFDNLEGAGLGMPAAASALGTAFSGTHMSCDMLLMIVDAWLLNEVYGSAKPNPVILLLTIACHWKQHKPSFSSMHKLCGWA